MHSESFSEIYTSAKKKQSSIVTVKITNVMIVIFYVIVAVLGITVRYVSNNRYNDKKQINAQYYSCLISKFSYAIHCQIH